MRKTAAQPKGSRADSEKEVENNQATILRPARIAGHVAKLGILHEIAPRARGTTAQDLGEQQGRQEEKEQTGKEHQEETNSGREVA